MTGKQKAVLWLGILLIITRLFTTGQWSAIWTALSNPGGGSGGQYIGSSKGVLGPGGARPLAQHTANPNGQTQVM